MQIIFLRKTMRIRSSISCYLHLCKVYAMIKQKKGGIVMKKWLCLVLALTILCLVGCADTPDEKENEPVELTIMSWNILNPAWGGGPAADRADGFIQTVTECTPDVLGLQEASRTWHAEFDALPANYAAVCDAANSGNPSMTTFFYNTDTLTLIESGVEDLDANSDIRVVAWAVFEANGSSKRFLITNTHPDSRTAECIAHTERYLQIAATLYREKGLPAFAVGDFNAIESSDAYALSVNDGFTDCKYAEGVKLVNDIDSYLYGDFGGIVTSGQGSRDHVFFKGDVTPIRFETLRDDTVQTVSDHLPVIAVVEI